MSLLEKLNIYGLSEIEDLIFAGLVTGDPILFVGRHGSAKTMLTKALADCLGLKFIAYDASKALFDDVIGFPNPKSLSEGVLDYIPTPISIWDKEFVLIDEISRANTSMQNKWLEIIRSRQLMGKKIPNLKYVFSAMNPPSTYSGTVVLDPALSGRFAFIITIPEIQQMHSDDLRKIIKNISEDDAAALNKTGVESCGREIKSLIEKSRKIFSETAAEYDNLLSDYITAISVQFVFNKIKLDGRRMGMLRRNCIAYLSVKSIRYGKKKIMKNIFENIYNCVRYSVPDESTGEPLREDVVMSVHLAAVKNKGDITNHESKIKVFFADSAVKMVENFIEFHKKLSEIDIREFVSVLTEKWKNAALASEIIDIYYAMEKLVVYFQKNPRIFSADTYRRTFELYSDIHFITKAIKELDISPNDADAMSVNFSDPCSEKAFVLTLNTCFRNKSQSTTGIDFNIKLYEQIKKNMMKLGAV